MKYLTRKQVTALEKALRRRGKTLPSLGQCAAISKPKTNIGHVCQLTHGKFEYKRQP